MMLRTVACEPASWVAMLPQKFSVATTRTAAESEGVEIPQAVASDATAPRTARAIRGDPRPKSMFAPADVDTASSIPVAHVACARPLRYNGGHAQAQSGARPGSRPRVERLATCVDDRGAVGAGAQGRGDRGLLDGLSRRVVPGREGLDPQGRHRSWAGPIRDRGPPSRPCAVRALRTDLRERHAMSPGGRRREGQQGHRVHDPLAPPGVHRALPGVRGGLLNPDSTRLAPNAPLEILGFKESSQHLPD